MLQYPIDDKRNYEFRGEVAHSKDERTYYGRGFGFITSADSDQRRKQSLTSGDPNRGDGPSGMQLPTDAEFFTLFHCETYADAAAEIEKQVKAMANAVRLHLQKRQVCFDNCVVNLEFWRMHPGMSDIGARIEVLLDGKQVAAPEKTTVEALREAKRNWADRPDSFFCRMYTQIDAALVAEMGVAQ